jgi:hypothetical protein
MVRVNHRTWLNSVSFYMIHSCELRASTMENPPILFGFLFFQNPFSSRFPPKSFSTFGGFSAVVTCRV